jgi:Tol biopolymer transport system component
MLSPDGSRIFFYQENRKDPYDWGMMVSVIGGTPQRVRMPVSEGDVGCFCWLKWAPDGKSFLYFKYDNGVANIWSAPTPGNKPPRRITNFQSDRIFAFDVLPDNRLVISRGERVRDVVLIKNVK